MRRTLLGLLAAVLIASGSTLVATPAQAAAKPVTIKKLSTQWIDWQGTAVVKPNVKKATKVKVIKKAMTVRKAGKVVRKNRSAVRLKPGTYGLTTKITYRLNGKKRTVSSKQQLVVKQGRCTTKADYRSIKVSTTAGSGDAVATVKQKLRNSGQLLSEFGGAMTLAEWRKELAAIDPDAAAAFDQLIDLYGADAVLDLGLYRVCQNPGKMVSVAYIDGHAIEKTLD